MNESIKKVLTFSSPETGDVLTAVLREGAQAMLTRAIRAEVDEWIASHAHLRDDCRVPCNAVNCGVAVGIVSGVG